MNSKQLSTYRGAVFLNALEKLQRLDMSRIQTYLGGNHTADAGVEAIFKLFALEELLAGKFNSS